MEDVRILSEDQAAQVLRITELFGEALRLVLAGGSVPVRIPPSSAPEPHTPRPDSVGAAIQRGEVTVMRRRA
jgi:hypothetical protein